MTEAVRTENLEIIDSYGDIPGFSSESEEVEFWNTHKLSKKLLDQMGPINDGSLPPTRSRLVPIRIDEQLIKRAKRLAAIKHTRYQTLLKSFMSERLYEEERREGLVR
jgi:predicted DNA binding CopG/RHH family protein